MRIGAMMYPAPTPDAARRYAEDQGVEVFEISLEIRPEPLPDETRRNILDCGRELAGKLALHDVLPLAMAHRDADFRRRLEEEVRDRVCLAGEAGIARFTLHTTCARTISSLEAGWRNPATRWLARALDNDVTPDFAESERVLVGFLRELAPLAESVGVRLALENNFREPAVFARRLDCIADVRRVVETVNHPALGVCFDLYKAFSTEPSLSEAIRGCGGRITNVHASDIEDADTAFHRSRRAIGSGRIAWGPALDALLEVGYDGPVILELMPTPADVRASVERLRALLAERQAR